MLRVRHKLQQSREGSIMLMPYDFDSFGSSKIMLNFIEQENPILFKITTIQYYFCNASSELHSF